MLDPLEPNGAVLPSKITYAKQDPFALTADISNAIWTGPDNISLMNLPESWLDRPIDSITVDSNAYDVSDLSTNVYHPSSVTNWQRNIAGVGASERNYLPLWMRSIQPGQKQQLGFKLAVPLCYCKPGTADTIVLNIKHSGFDFKSLDYSADRFIIDSVEGNSTDKYLVFKNDRITV